MKDVMAGTVEKFGRLLEHTAGTNPAMARKMLLAAYRLFGVKQTVLPERQLPESRQYLAGICMDSMVQPLSHMERSVLVSLFTPAEIIRSFGLRQLCAEQISTYINGAGAEQYFATLAEAEGIAETFCSYHKVLAGTVLSGVLPSPAAIVNTSLACDANNLSFRMIAEQRDIPQFYIDVPYERNEDSVQYVSGQMRQCAAFLEEVSGKTLDMNQLRRNTERSAKTIRLLKQTLPYRKERFLRTTLTSEMYEALLVHTSLGSAPALKYAGKLLEDYRKASAGSGKKILWMHSNPFWQKPLQDKFNYGQNQYIALSEMCYDTWTDADPGDPFRFMAERLVYNSYNGPVEWRIERALEMAETVAADGVILFCHWGCRETCGASAVIASSLEERGFPVLVLNGDGVDRRNASDGQLSTRVEAFLEMIGAEQ